MSKKQNNDDTNTGNLMKATGDKMSSKSKEKLQQSEKGGDNQEEQPSLSSQRPSKRYSQLSSGKLASTQVPTSVAGSNLNPALQILLPISIYQLDQKHLNTYLKQFMEISSFQAILKGKNLIDLIKQAPSSKISLTVISKCFKLFKSNIPEAVLCSFQFFRDLIEIGHWKISDLMQELLLMPMVEIIQYRSYMPQLERGNTYFLSQMMRYGQDDKTNHLVKISSTFFRMVHEVLYVWGMHYFPDSKFNKMLNKLMVADQVRFPQYPDQFRFYSKPRVDLYQKLISNNRKIHQKQQMDFKAKKSVQATNDSNKNQSTIRKNESQKHSNPSKEKVQIKLQGKNQITKQIQAQTQKIEQMKTRSPQNISNKKQLQPNFKKQNIAISKQQNPRTPKHEKFEDQIQSIRLETKNQPKKASVLEGKQTTLPINSVQQYKKMKPSKIKSKKSSIPNIKSSQKSIQIDKSITQSLVESRNSLNMIKESENIEIQQPKGQKYEANSLNSEIQKQKIQRARSQSILNDKNEENTFKIQAEPTFRHAFNPSDSAIEQKNISIVVNDDNSPSSGRIMPSSERQRYIEPISDQSRESPHQPQPQNQKHHKNRYLMQNNVAIKDFFRTELESLKFSIIQGIKDDIAKIIHQKIHTSENKKQQEKNEKSENYDNSSLQVPQNKNQFGQQSSEQQMISARFGAHAQQKQVNPTVQAFEFIKKKLKSSKKIRNPSKVKRPSILDDKQLAIYQNNQQSQIERKQNKNIPQIISQKTTVNFGVNTESAMKDDIFEQIQSLKEKLNLMTASLPKQTLPLSKHKENNITPEPNAKFSFFNTPSTINKNQLKIKEVEISALRSSVNTQRKKSKSKLSQRRSSLEATLIQKAALRPQMCGNLFGEAYGGPNNLLFNVAINSLQKKRKSIIFC